MTFLNSPIKSCLTLILLSFFFFSNAQQPAFPEAYGAGAYAVGGRGGKVIHVTSLLDILDPTNPDYVGTLRWALTSPENKIGARTIVFDVSGIIDLQDWIYASNLPGDEGGYDDNLSILGQSAPMGGITITGNTIKLKAIGHLVIRYLKFRITDSSYGGALSCGNADNIIYDHLSGSHCPNSIVFGITANGEGVQADKHTIQNTLIGNSKNGIIIGNSDFAQNATVVPYGSVSVLRNAFYSVGWRVPGKFGGAGKFDVINNVAHNWDNRLIRTDPYPFKMNHIGNHYQSGGQSRTRGYPNLHKTWTGFGFGDPEIYQEDNYYSEDVKNNGYNKPNQWSVFQGEITENVPDSYFTNTILPVQGRVLPIINSIDIKDDVLEFVGASKYIKDDGTPGFYRDQYDTFQVNGIAIQDLQYSSNRTIELPVQSISNTRPNNFYVSNSHIPEAFLVANGLTGTPTIHNDIAPSGYTWLEEYLNGVDLSNNAIAAESVQVTPSTAELQISETLQLNVTFTPDNATNQSGTWTSSNEDIAIVDINGLVTGVTTGSVTITFTSADGGFTDTSEITVFPEALEASAGIDQQICEGENATLTATGGETYLWNTGDTTASITVEPTETTIYTVTVYDVTGDNSDSDDVSVIVNPIPVANAGDDVIVCSGENVTLTASGGDTYLWSTGDTTSSISVSPTDTTTFTVEVFQNDCSDIDEVVVTVENLPSIDAGEDVNINMGESITLNATGANSYEWNTGETVSSITVAPNSTTTYTVTGSSSSGCSNNDSVTVTVTDTSVSANAGPDVAICEGSSTTLTASGGTFYEWSTGETTASIDVTPNSTTNYTVTVLDSSGANPGTDDVTVTVNPLPIANAGENVSLCLGSSVTLTATGGDAYLWSNGETTASIIVSPNDTTTYSVEVNQNGCTDTDNVIVTVNSLPEVFAGDDITILLGESATLSASGANSYEWNTGETNSSITVTPTANTIYTVNGTSNNGCTNFDTVTVNVIDTSVTADAGSDVTICEGNDIILTASGGSTYIWNTGETTSAITVSPNSTTTYTVIAYDPTGTNSDSDDVVVNVNPFPTVDAGQDVTTCRGTSVTLTATGGESFIWSNGATSASITVNPNNTTTYTVEVSQNGCTASDEVLVTVNPLPSVNAGSDITISLGQSVILNATGAISYSWNTGASGSSLEVSPTETTSYTVTGENPNGCSKSDTVTVNVQTGNDVFANAGEDVTLCDGGSTTLTATGGTTYLWSNGATTANITVSPNSTSTYTVTAYDSTGLNSDTDDVVVTVNPLPTANAGQDVSTCRGTGVTLTATGGESYIWSNGDTAASITVNPNNTTDYTVEVSQNGCTATDDVRVTVNPLPNVNAGTDVSINLGQSVTLTATGANNYSWNTGQNAASITVSPNATTTYTVTGANNNGCDNTDTVRVTVVNDTTVVNAYAGEDQNICRGQTVVLTATGGDTYVWSTGETSQSITVTPDHTTHYTVVATIGDVQGEDDVSVYVSNNPNVNITNGTEATILEGEYITLSANGANRYEWNNGATQPNIAVNPSSTTTYRVTGYNSNNCSAFKQVTVNVIPSVIAFAGDDQLVCRNEEVTLTASGGDEYLWNTGDTTASITVTPTEDTEYSVTVYNDLDYDTADVMVYVNNCSPVDTPENPEYFEFLVYPNPTAGELNIKISGLIIVTNIALYDLSGKMLFHETISNDTQQNFIKKLDLSPYTDGLYLLKLTDDNHAITKKIVINK